MWIPKGRYNGQNFIKLVNRKMADKATKIIPKVPVTTFHKNNPVITTAKIKRMIRSVFPKFCFMFWYLLVN